MTTVLSADFWELRKGWSVGSTGSVDREEERLQLRQAWGIGSSEGTERAVMACGEPTCSSASHGLWLSRMCLPELGTGTQQ